MSSIDLDELIATLNTHHIGSEALDIANLHAQLQQALQAHAQTTPFPTSPVQITYSLPVGAPTNTPTAHTPSWGHFADSTHSRRRRRNSSAASTRPRGKDVILEEESMDQDVMEDVEEEEQVDASLYASSSPLPSSQSPSFGSSPSSYASTDPFLAAQLQAAEQRSRQPSFFTQVATAQLHTSPFYTTQQAQLPSSSSGSKFSGATTQSGCFVGGGQANGRPAQLKIDTGPRFASLDVRMR